MSAVQCQTRIFYSPDWITMSLFGHYFLWKYNQRRLCLHGVKCDTGSVVSRETKYMCRYMPTWCAALWRYVSLQHVEKTFNLITVKAQTACHIIREKENSRLDPLFRFYSGWVRSAVALYLPLKAVREFSLTLAACVGTSTICDTKWEPHTYTHKNIPFVARCISSWHRRITARRTTFCFSVWSLHGCSHGFTPKTSKPWGLEALNWPMVWTWASRCVCDPCDRLTASSFPPFYPKM